MLAWLMNLFRRPAPATPPVAPQPPANLSPVEAYIPTSPGIPVYPVGTPAAPLPAALTVVIDTRTRVTPGLLMAVDVNQQRAKDIATLIDDKCLEFDIVSRNGVCMLVAQGSHESGFVAKEENLNYSAKRLSEVWPNRYALNGVKGKPNELALKIAGNPELIANHTYADRMGNGSVESGDGWRFRGRGFIQLTGRANYTAFGKSVGMTAEEAVAYALTDEGSVAQFFWYWKTRGCINPAFKGDVKEVTRLINGGYTGLEHRTLLFNRALAYVYVPLTS